MNSLLVVNGDFYTGTKVVRDKALLIIDRQIVGFLNPSEVPSDARVLDARGKCISPGFIDLQVNGAAGVMITDRIDQATLAEIDRAQLLYGTTRWLPTLISSPYSVMERMRDLIRDNAGKYGVIGVHFEGPWLNHISAGVHNPEFIRVPSEREISLIEQASGYGVCLVTLAPEIIHRDLLRKILGCKKVTVCLGHTAADFDLAGDCFRMGAKGITHAMNCMPGIQSRMPGPVCAAIHNRGVFASIIVDGHHVDFSVVSLLKRAFGQNSLFLISDAMPPAPDGMDMEFRIGDYKVHSTGGACVTADGRIAGSCLSLAKAIRNCVQRIGIPLDEALRMATLYPAALVGLDSTMGRISPGFIADLVAFNNQIEIEWVVRDGIPIV